jgi:hypothetical protein
MSNNDARRILREARALLEQQPAPYTPSPRAVLLHDEPDEPDEFEPAPAPEPKLDTAPPNWSDIEERFAQEREFSLAVIAEALALTMRDAQEDVEKELQYQVRTLKADIAAAQDAVAQLRSALDLERTRVLDLPALPARRDLN